MINIIEENLLDKVQQQKFLQGLQVNLLDEESSTFSQNLQSIPWTKIKLQLELLERSDVVNLIQKNTLITKGKTSRLVAKVSAALAWQQSLLYVVFFIHTPNYQYIFLS